MSHHDLPGIGSEFPATCAHVRASHVVPGWKCCQCRTYNGYQRPWCRNCGHLACYDRGGLLGVEAAELAQIGSDRAKVFDWLEKRAEKGDA
jgi:hypothetical protein